MVRKTLGRKNNRSKSRRQKAGWRCNNGTNCDYNTWNKEQEAAMNKSRANQNAKALAAIGSFAPAATMPTLNLSPVKGFLNSVISSVKSIAAPKV